TGNSGTQVRRDREQGTRLSLRCAASVQTLGRFFDQAHVRVRLGVDVLLEEPKIGLDGKRAVPGIDGDEPFRWAAVWNSLTQSRRPRCKPWFTRAMATRALCPTPLRRVRRVAAPPAL